MTAAPPTESPVRGPTAAEAFARRLDKPMSALGLVFLLLVLGQNVARPPLTGILAALGWVLWAVFVAEFVLRAVIARDQRAFWRRNWWQVVFLAVPFLRIARAASFVRLTRAARVGGVLSSAVRGTRSAGRLLSGRLGWLAVVTCVVVLAASQLLVIVGAYDVYADALHAAALATVTGEPFGSPDPLARVLEVVLGVYSVVVFATLAGALGAYFLERPGSPRAQAPDAVVRPDVVHEGR